MAKIRKIKIGTTNYDIDLPKNSSKGVYFVSGNTSGTTGVWTGNNSDITEYFDGLVVAYKIGIAGASSTTLNINSLGAKKCYLRGTSSITTHYAVGTVVLLVYNTTTSAFYSADYDTNSNTWRAIKVNGTQALSTSTSSNELNLTNGNDISIEDLGSGSIKISVDDSTYLHKDEVETVSVVKSISGGSGNFTPTTKYLHKTTTNTAPNEHTHTVTVNGTSGKNSGTGVSVVTGVAGGSGSLTSNTTSTDGIAYIANVSGGSAVSATTKYMKFSAGTTPKSSATPTHTSTNTGTNSGTAVTALTGVKVTTQPTISLTANGTTATGRIQYVESISSTAASLTGTKTFVTGYPNFSGGFLTGTKTFVTAAIKSATTTGARSTAGTGTAARRTLTISTTTASADSTGTVGFTAASLGTASTGTVGISGGTATQTLKYLSASASGTAVGADGTATVAPSGHNHAYDKTTGVTLTAGTAPSINFNTGTSTDTPYISTVSGGSAVSATTKYLHHSHTGASASSTATVAPNEHTHSYGNSTALTTSKNSGSAVAAITGIVANTTKATGDITYIESATHTHTGASVSATETVIKEVETN